MLSLRFPVLIALFAACIISCNSERTSDPTANENNCVLDEDSIFSRLSRSPEIVALESTTSLNAGDKIVYVVRERPSKSSDNYLVQVGVDNKTRFRPVYNFLAHCTTGEIVYIDTETEKRILLSDWETGLQPAK